MSDFVKIKAYINPKEEDDLGLHKYNLNMLDGVKHTHELVAIESTDGIWKYKTGLDYYALSVMNLPKDEREAKQIEIKKQLIEYTKIIDGIIIKEDDPEWLNKIKSLKPDNKKFWNSSKFILQIGPDGLKIDKDTLYGKLIFTAIKEGGYPNIARNLKEVLTSNYQYKFYLDQKDETSSIVTELYKLRDEAGGRLNGMYRKGSNSKLMYIIKNISSDPSQYKKKTPIDVLYADLHDYIEGKTVETNKKLTAQTFLDLEAKSLEDLKLGALVKDALFYRILQLKGDGMIYYLKLGTAMGKNKAQVIEYLKTPLNEDIFKQLSETIEKYWDA